LSDVQVVEGVTKDCKERGEENGLSTGFQDMPGRMRFREVEAVMFRVIKGFCLGTIAAGIQKLLEPIGGNKMLA
jgi:hypothetical protein